MFCPPGYVTLSKLWEVFLARKSAEIFAVARDKYLADDFSERMEFGSPLDFAEGIFLKTFEVSAVTLCSPTGKVMKVQPKLADCFSALFQRASVFESSLIAEKPEEAGTNGEWLCQMGSRRFVAWPHKQGDPKRWAAQYARSSSALVQENPLDRLPYHTLPFCFERIRFTVPESLPPWCEDARDEVYVKSLVPNFLGHSICLEEKQARKWRTDSIEMFGCHHLLGHDLPVPTQVGRPDKQKKARKYYHALFPDGHKASWQEACNDIENKFGLRVSIKTLKRAVENSK